jgi:uncharacterized protein (TIGR00251 family)
MNPDLHLLSKCATEKDDDLLLTIMMHPGAKTAKIEGIDPFRGSLGVKVTAQAQKGKANMELIKLLATVFGVPTSDILIIRGEKSRQKTVKIVNFNKKELEKKLNSLDHRLSNRG